MSFHAFGRDAVNVDELVIVEIDEVPIDVEHVGKTSRKPCAEVDAASAEDRR